MTPTTTATEKSEHAAVLTTSLQRLKAAGACTDRYRHLLHALGKTRADDEPLNLLTIVELNGIEDAIWALSATEQNCDKIARLFACDCAEAVLHLFERERPEDMRPRVAIEVARRFALGNATAEELAAARAAAWAAAWDAARDVAWAAARDVAWAVARAAAWAVAWAAARAAARDVAWAAARAAAWDAAWDAARDDQKRLLIRYLLPGEELS